MSMETETRWAVLQNHRVVDPERGSFYALLAALDGGWQVEPPVYARPRWGAENAGKQMYHCILRRGPATTLVSVEDSSHLRAFLDEQSIPVNRQGNF
ncbi:MAG: hypothetical protein JW850_12970 [Thermoflexales bacterium]|nr:hypothetical protein [Thermoflexales bacterium]